VDPPSLAHSVAGTGTWPVFLVFFFPPFLRAFVEPFPLFYRDPDPSGVHQWISFRDVAFDDSVEPILPRYTAIAM